jgi:hypothetical protein
VSEAPLPKLPGWVRRPTEFTPQLNLRQASGRAGPDISILLDPANDVAYKMIGGAYGVLGAEVLGQYVPRALDEQRWGIYVREAGVAWLCSQIAPHIDRHPKVRNELPPRLARGIAAHHYVHLAVEAAVTEDRGTARYLDLLVDRAPRHGPFEEILGELLFRSEVLLDVETEARGEMEAAVDAVIRKTPEGRGPDADRGMSAVVDLVNAGLLLTMSLAEFQLRNANQPVPQYLVLEPHLPDPVASAIRKALLG